MKKRLLNINESCISKYLFIFSLIVCLILGLSLSYNFDFTKNLNLLFESDTGRIINDMTKFDSSHLRTSVHPLFVILTEPIYYFVKAIFINKMLSLVVISSLVTSLIILYIYKILSLYGQNKILKIILCLCYLFSFANYVFTAGIEAYNIAALLLVLLWYYVLKKYPQNKLTKSEYFVLITLGVGAFAITITNTCIFLIIIFFMFVFKKISLKSALVVSFLAIVFGLNFSSIQHIIWYNTESLNATNYEKEMDYSQFSITSKKIINVIKNDYYYAIIGNDMHVRSNDNGAYANNNYVITFNTSHNYLTIGVVSIFYLLMIILLFRNYRHHPFANICILTAIFFNTLLHIFYGNELPFLYSLHFLYLFYLIFGINLMHEKNKILLNITKYYLIILLVFELIFNNYFFVKIIKIVKTILPCNYYVANFDILPTMFLLLCIMAIIIVIINYIIYFFKKYKKAKNHDARIKYGIIIALLIVSIPSLCILLEVNEANETFFLKKINANPNDIYIDTNRYLKKDDQSLKNHFKEEVKLYNEYQKEYTNLLKKYRPKKVSFLNRENYYFFGLGNRRKLLFRNNGLLDIESGETLYFWNVSNSLVIPNGYMVIIETYKKDYIKIYEDNFGVHYNVNGKDTIIEGTDTKINLYSFENQQWPNTKKVLYSEILFNIKDSKIYPNVLVYDNPWYRDAAMASMVLKITNNTDLISDWVNSITDVYDRQNRGVSEPDNLGELLYIISTQDDYNWDLINKIKTEADTVAKKHKDDYYLIGMTDFSIKPLYQNLWYQCGMNSLNLASPFKTDGLSDEYGCLTWWADNKVSNKNIYSANIDYPYLSVAAYHKLNKGKITMNNNLYPLSWERDAAVANYQGMQILDNYYVSEKISPIHTWAAAEMLLLLLDEEKVLNVCYN